MLTTIIITFQRIRDFHTLLLTYQLTTARTFSSIAYELTLYKYHPPTEAEKTGLRNRINAAENLIKAYETDVANILNFVTPFYDNLETSLDSAEKRRDKIALSLLLDIVGDVRRTGMQYKNDLLVKSGKCSSFRTYLDGIETRVEANQSSPLADLNNLPTV